MVNKNSGNISEIDTFININIKSFAGLIKDHCEIKPELDIKYIVNY